MLMSWSIFSQTDTTVRVDSIVCIPKYIAKKIAKDLVILDEKTAINKLLESDIDIYKKIIVNRDSVVTLKTKQLDLSHQQYVNSSMQYSIVNEQLNKQRKSLKFSKFKTTISQIALIVVTIFYAIKN